MHEVHRQPDGSVKLVLPQGEPGPAPKERTGAQPESMPESEVMQQEIAAAQATLRAAVEAAEAVQPAAPTKSRRPRRGEE